MGAWIEMFEILEDNTNIDVAPLVGAWIEICTRSIYFSSSVVAPLVGAWIEIVASGAWELLKKSLPLWERGLK